VASMAGAEKRRASHILIEAGDKRSEDDANALAASLLDKARAGADFSELAVRNSEDTGSAKAGGDLGFAGKGVYDPAFESALFALQSVGEISDVVKSEFGYHIIKLLGVDGARPPALAEKRDALVAEIRVEKAKEKLSLAVDEINRLGFESGDLSVVAENYKKSVKTSNWVARSGGGDVFAEPEALKVAFSDAVIQEQRNSDVVELSDGRLLIVRLKEHEPARLQEFQEVAEQVKERAQAKYAMEKAQEVSNAVLASVKAGEDATSILSAAGVTWENHEALTRTSAAPDKAFIDKAFSLPKPLKDGKPSVASVSLGGEGFGVVLVKSVDEPASDKTPEQRKQLGQGIAYRNGTLDFQAYLGTVRKDTDVEINE
jgi:peptidyl-prolyl cis-trans isomerase D